MKHEMMNLDFLIVYYEFRFSNSLLEVMTFEISQAKFVYIP